MGDAADAAAMMETDAMLTTVVMEPLATFVIAMMEPLATFVIFVMEALDASTTTKFFTAHRLHTASTAMRMRMITFAKGMSNDRCNSSSSKNECNGKSELNHFRV